MTITHESHFGLRFMENEYYVFFSGDLANCKRMAFAHGLEITGHENRGDIQHEQYRLSDGSTIRKECAQWGGWTLMMFRGTWENS